MAPPLWALETAVVAPLLRALETAAGLLPFSLEMAEPLPCRQPGLPALPISGPQEVDHCREGFLIIPPRLHQPVPDSLRGECTRPLWRMRSSLTLAGRSGSSFSCHGGGWSGAMCPTSPIAKHHSSPFKQVRQTSSVVEMQWDL
ncbi:UNVERIFIED_CONTAM: hypothetical protein FKN15_040009 [Acipenser sinensis]